jgi:hypothetical protein
MSDPSIPSRLATGPLSLIRPLRALLRVASLPRPTPSTVCDQRASRPARKAAHSDHAATCRRLSANDHSALANAISFFVCPVPLPRSHWKRTSGQAFGQVSVVPFSAALVPSGSTILDVARLARAGHHIARCAQGVTLDELQQKAGRREEQAPAAACSPLPVHRQRSPSPPSLATLRTAPRASTPTTRMGPRCGAPSSPRSPRSPCPSPAPRAGSSALTPPKP